MDGTVSAGDLERLMREIDRYLAAVDSFREAGRRLRWGPERPQPACPASCAVQQGAHERRT
jgi:hypothetical protein